MSERERVFKNERNMTALKARHEQKTCSRRAYRAHTTIIAQYERHMSAMVVQCEHDMNALTFWSRPWVWCGAS